MIDPLDYLQQARMLLLQLMGDEIREDELKQQFYQLKVVLTSGITIYIRYNEYGEYGYQLIFSPLKNDLARFDNFDDKWEISSKPHHFHQKGGKGVIASVMIGEPSNDIPLLVKFIKHGKI